jgi:predicted ribosomally synthesized peptide with SipW-like signal peptide
MTQDTEPKLYDLSRRKMLAGVGAVGLASAGAGLGTSALFSDTETFEGNALTAGELDLLVDWQQTYSYSTGGEEITTFVNAHPDHDGDGEQSIIDPETEEVSRYTDESRNLAGLNCENIPPLSEADFGTDPITEEPMETLMQFSDIKPGDEGEVTFSLHLCDNPGYVWMQASEVSESGGDHPDPEMAVDPDNLPDLAEEIAVKLWYDSDCDNVYDEAEPADIMLTLDFSGSMLYDQFGGVVNEEEIEIDGVTYDETTKIDLVELGVKQFVEYLQESSADVEVGVAYFDGEKDDNVGPRVGLLQGLTADLDDVDDAVSDLRQKLANVVAGATNDPNSGDGNPDPSSGGGIAEGTYIGEGVNEAQIELRDNGRSGVEYVNIVLSDGESFNGQGPTQFSDPTEAADNARDPEGSPTHGSPTPASPATNLYTISVGSANDSVLQSMAGPAAGAGGATAYFFDVDDPINIPTVFGILSNAVGPESEIFSGTLADALVELESGNGLPLDGNVATPFDEFTDPPADDDREPFAGGQMYCLGFSWELPFEVGNKVQGDTLGFNLSFYTEQARYNDGSGPIQA